MTTDMEEKSTFEKELDENGVLIYTNVGVSMMPLIKENRDVMIIKKAEPGNIKRYDAVLFRRENIKGRGKYVLHRILKILPDGKYFIAGDNETVGETVSPQQILGVLVSLKRKDKQIKLEGFKYKAYVYLWCAPYHFRFAVLHTKHFLKYLVSAVLYKLRIRR